MPDTTPSPIRHDRAGRLVDAQYFEQLAFPRGRFSPEALAELERFCPRTVEVRGEPQFTFMCHCEFCQRRTGTSYHLDAWFPRDAVTLEVGGHRPCGEVVA